MGLNLRGVALFPGLVFRLRWRYAVTSPTSPWAKHDRPARGCNGSPVAAPRPAGPAGSGRGREPTVPAAARDKPRRGVGERTPPLPPAPGRNCRSRHAQGRPEKLRHR